MRLAGKRMRKPKRLKTEHRPSCTSTSARVHGAVMNEDVSIRETVSSYSLGAICSSTY